MTKHSQEAYPDDPEVLRYKEAYLAFSEFYRPNLHLRRGWSDLDSEALEWAMRMSEETDTCKFHIGVPNYNHNKGFIYAIEIARACCTPDTGLARRLMALLKDEIGME